MKMQLYDAAGKPSVNVEIPDAIIEAAHRLRRCMHANDCTVFGRIIIPNAPLYGSMGEPAKETVADAEAVYNWMVKHKASRLCGLGLKGAT
jgi:hypothetical protein